MGYSRRMTARNAPLEGEVIAYHGPAWHGKDFLKHDRINGVLIVTQHAKDRGGFYAEWGINEEVFVEFGDDYIPLYWIKKRKLRRKVSSVDSQVSGGA